MLDDPMVVFFFLAFFAATLDLILIWKAVELKYKEQRAEDCKKELHRTSDRVRHMMEFLPDSARCQIVDQCPDCGQLREGTLTKTKFIPKIYENDGRTKITSG